MRHVRNGEHGLRVPESTRITRSVMRGTNGQVSAETAAKAAPATGKAREAVGP